ncbi:MAG: tRNA (N6-isopentenyl adenosine(37)-C2)-methylthiotransferase MiaB [Patescibacteria group bacterium]
MKYYLLTFGCQMNKSDSERAAAVLENLGYQKTDSEESADLIMVLACSVRQSAIDRIYGRIKIWKKIKEKRPLITILTGCILKEDKRKLIPHFDFIFPITDLVKLPEKLKNLPCQQIESYFHIHPHYQNNFQAYVPISTGCNNFCTYCVVPYVRGPEICRPAEEIINEVKELIGRGYKEICLLGQNVNSYFSNLNFPKLLKKINDIPGNFWLRFLTSHPKDFSDELIETMVKCKKICEYLHLPIQSGDNQILKEMNRRYTVEHYKNIIEKIRKKIPDIAISTDIIVGFPGETEKQFQNTTKLMKEIKFDMAYIAEYSPRPQTAAIKLNDNVPKKEKEKRRKILTEILKQTAFEKNKKYLGQIVEILVDSEDKDNFYGKTRTFKTVKIKKSPFYQIGEFEKVKIISATPFGLAAS